MIKLGVSPLSWTNDVLEDLGDDISLETCLQEASTAGYEGIELGRKFPRKTEELKPILDKYNLKLASGWYSGFIAQRSIKEELKNVKEHAQLLVNLGATVMVYGECGLIRNFDPFDQNINISPNLKNINHRNYANTMTQFATALFEEYGLQLAYHHHLMMLVEKQDELDTFFSETGESVGILLDTGHAAAVKVNIGDMIDKFGSRIRHIHLKDIRPNVLNSIYQHGKSFNQGVREGMFTIPGDGVNDYASIVNFIHNSNYQGWLIVEAEQDPKKMLPFDTVLRANKYVKKQFFK